MLATLLGANLRRGRNVAAMDSAAALKVYEETPARRARAPPRSEPQRCSGTAALESDGSLKVRCPPASR